MASRQKAIFEDIHDRYYSSTSDKYAMAYKERYIYPSVVEYFGERRSLIELACGRGEASAYLKQVKPSLEVTGCDISEAAARDFTLIHDRPCFVSDLTKPFEHQTQYEAVVVMGGIHHMVADLDTAFANIRKLLIPGGRLIMAEPNADFVMNPLRRMWYRIDKSNFDASTERALSHEQLWANHGKGFEFIGTRYFGGPAYFLLMLNMFLRVPDATKPFTAPLLMGIERVYDMLPGRLPFSSFVACWERT